MSDARVPEGVPTPDEWELERSDLVATLAHELRSPLTGVKGFVQAVLNRWDKLTDDQKKFMLTTALVDADRLSRLITEMLDVARLDTGRLQLHRRPTDAGAIVRRVVSNVGMTTSRTIEVDIDDEMDPVNADPDKFAQVMTNLVDNAVRHGDGKILVRVQTDESSLCLQIDDEGFGIPAEFHDQVFTKFWRGGASAGTGLGLYVVGGLVEAHGGTITIGDRPGGGARLNVTWPLWAD